MNYCQEDTCSEYCVPTLRFCLYHDPHSIHVLCSLPDIRLAWDIRNVLKRDLVFQDGIDAHEKINKAQDIIHRLQPLLRNLSSVNRKSEFLSHDGPYLLRESDPTPWISVWRRILSPIAKWKPHDIWCICQAFMFRPSVYHTNVLDFIAPYLQSLYVAWQRAEVLKAFTARWANNREQEPISTLCFLAMNAPTAKVFKTWMAHFQWSWVEKLHYLERHYRSTYIFIRWFVKCLILDETIAYKRWEYLIQQRPILTSLKILQTWVNTHKRQVAIAIAVPHPVCQEDSLVFKKSMLTKHFMFTE
jgi:hypothetical protein